MEIGAWEASAEQQVRELKELLDNGNLSQGEYEELVEDILDMQGISDDLSLEENKIRAQKAIDALKVVAGLL